LDPDPNDREEGSGEDQLRIRKGEQGMPKRILDWPHFSSGFDFAKHFDVNRSEKLDRVNKIN